VTATAQISAFAEAVARTLSIEGGYSLDPADAGGETNHGITARVARAFGYAGAMADMTLEQARAIYRARYWTALQLDAVALLSRDLALEIFDTAVNMGTSTAGLFLQRALNVLNNGATFYRDVTVDGAVGPMTLAALRDFLTRRGDEGEAVLLAAINCLQGVRYIELAEARPSDERFVYGWIRTRVLAR
jgi:lysozyme family protein